jgi:glycogen debranching enzyme
LRDSVDPTAADRSGIVHRDGSVPTPPLADADCQAITVAALRALAALSGDEAPFATAAELREQIGTVFDAETMALDADCRLVDGAGSQLGWLLWADALPAEAAERAAARLCEPDILTDFGLRTLSARHPRFAQDGYHRGAVWPFDSWIGWGGLRASGRDAAAEQVRTGVLDAIDRLGGAPELYAVDDAGPQHVAIANRVQAWTVGARMALEAGWDGRRERR